ncbi:right-handed parallel beta-helix repeat-containing protein [Paenibacillus sp. GCM10012307]|uniref:Right-handed parallel beta-helix repeat-containing protein n=1 Tax=Paenibacillus roseus TaxID=2798579 RepID=A0A934IX31_9BACL|nr:right-handed parallel beta-helix repeat-containing protein [Paenibacillus roseus]MBJ6360887.1 right-handed parallel beta-helix repeat-containing protein [Paenibacillus roseus]
MAKTNWDMNDTVKPADLNQIGQEINDNVAQANILKGRKINTSGGLSGGGDLSGDRTLSITDGGVTDAKIGNRTISDATAPTSDTGTITGLMSGLANMVKGITGGATWRTAPGMTIAAIKTILDAATNLATASAIIKRDSSGRAKVAAPSATDDIARKQEVDAAIVTAATDAASKFIAKTAMGSGGGIDADTVDGYHLDQDLRKAANATFATLDLYGTNSFKMYSGGSDHTYLAMFPRLADKSKRGMYLGFGVSGGNNLVLSNEIDEGDLLLQVKSGKTVIANSFFQAVQYISTTTSVAPLQVASTLKVDKLHADMLDGAHADTGATASTIAMRGTDSSLRASIFNSTVASGTSPITVVSSTVVTNLNADMVDGFHAAQGVSTPNTLATRNASGDLHANSFASSANTGVQPIYVNSTTLVTNLNADMVDGYHANGGAIGSTLAVRDSYGDLTSKRFFSTQTTGISPFMVVSTTMVENLNADMVDGFHVQEPGTPSTIPVRDGNGTLNSSSFWANTSGQPYKTSSAVKNDNLNADMVDGFHLDQDVRTTASPTHSRLTLSGANGTAPLQVTSSTVVTNLNADMVDGKHTSDLIQRAGVDNQTIYGNQNSDLTLQLLSTDGKLATIYAIGSMGTSTKGAGRVYVGVNTSQGGGMEFTTESADRPLSGGGDFHLTLFRSRNSNQIWTARNNTGTNDWEFAGKVTAASLAVTSTTVVTNLNADMVDGLHSSDLMTITGVASTSINYYVSPSGSDSNTGTSSGSPFLTINKALLEARRGYGVRYAQVRINLADGTYNETINIQGGYYSGYNYGLWIQSSTGVIGNCIISGTVTVDGLSGFLIGSVTLSTASAALTINNTQYALIQNLNITASGSTGIDVNRGSSAYISNCTISNRGQAIRADGVSTVFSINNTGSGNTQYGLYAQYGGKIIKNGTQPSGATNEGALVGGTIATTA